jgi:hypothetical protein
MKDRRKIGEENASRQTVEGHRISIGIRPIPWLIAAERLSWVIQQWPRHHKFTYPIRKVGRGWQENPAGHNRYCYGNSRWVFVTRHRRRERAIRVKSKWDGDSSEVDRCCLRKIGNWSPGYDDLGACRAASRVHLDHRRRSIDFYGGRAADVVRRRLDVLLGCSGRRD